MVLDRIKKVNDIKQLNEEELEERQEEIRDFLVEIIAKTGGHLASNLGVIELTMALHLSVWRDERIPNDAGRPGGCIQYRAQLHVYFRRTWHGAGKGTDR